MSETNEMRENKKWREGVNKNKKEKLESERKLPHEIKGKRTGKQYL